MSLDCDAEKWIDSIYRLYPRKLEPRTTKIEIKNALNRIMQGQWEGKKFTRLQAVSALAYATLLFAESPAGRRGTFTIYPVRWYKRDRYLDDISEWQRSGDEEEADEIPPVSNAPWEKYKAEQKKAAEEGKMATDEDYALMRSKLKELFGDPNHRFPAKA
jgi:hypothetical protein